MYVALALISLSDKKIRNMSSDVILVAYGIAPKYLLQAKQLSVKV
jgi:hypothetical protein